MSIKLPESVAAYFDAINERDIDAMLAPFAQTAIVKDEGREMRGVAAIRGWMEETTRKYGVAVAVMDVATTESRTAVTCRVSGNFAGSPIDLQYDISLAGGKIASLEIHP